jgi:superfamily II DNA or RNA helicase
MLQINNDILSLTFSNWNAEEYDLFIKSKQLPEQALKYDWKNDTYTMTTPARFSHVFGIETPGVDMGWMPLADHLFDYQKFIVEQALSLKRFAAWCDTGLGKTAIFLEFTRQILHRYQKKVLIVVPLNIISQTIEENRKFYGENAFAIYRIKSREDMIRWCTDGKPGAAIVNPDKFIPRDGDPEMISEIRHCMAVVLDEASLLRASAGKIKWSIIKSCRGLEYKLSCTATPAPNDSMEYASQGSYLEKLRSEGEILWTFFKRDKEGNWGIRPHAKDAFYRFMAGWSIYLRSPKNYGFADNLKDLPEPEYFEYKLKVNLDQLAKVHSLQTQDGQLELFSMSDTKLGMVNRIKYSQIAKGFIYDDNRKPSYIESGKPKFVADLIKQESEAGHQIIVWTVFDEESEIIQRLSSVPVTVISGKTARTKRDEIIENFRNGTVPVLISKASLIGHGLNFQHCTSMIFSGFDDSFENYYQAVRRAYRYGQKKSVRIHVPYIPELEGVIWNNILKKQAQFVHDVTVQERSYKKAISQIMKGFTE